MPEKKQGAMQQKPVEETKPRIPERSICPKCKIGRIYEYRKKGEDLEFLGMRRKISYTERSCSNCDYIKKESLLLSVYDIYLRIRGQQI